MLDPFMFSRSGIGTRKSRISSGKTWMAGISRLSFFTGRRMIRRIHRMNMILVRGLSIGWKADMS